NEFYTLSLHDALPIYEFAGYQSAFEPQKEMRIRCKGRVLKKTRMGALYNGENLGILRRIKYSKPMFHPRTLSFCLLLALASNALDRKSTRLNSSHDQT